MAEHYDQQDGAPQTQPDSGETVSEQNEAHPATIGERSTEEGVAGQGLGQMPGSKDQQDDSGKQQ